MSDKGEHESGSEASGRPDAVHAYRCPVCGHTDGVSFATADRLQVDCSHCGASLEVRLVAEEKERVSVQVDTGE